MTLTKCNYFLLGVFFTASVFMLGCNSTSSANGNSDDASAVDKKSDQPADNQNSSNTEQEFTKLQIFVDFYAIVVRNTSEF